MSESHWEQEWADLAAWVASLAPAGRRFVALIDGGSGSGKTSLGRATVGALEASGRNAHLVSLDAFYPGWSGLEAASRMVVDDVLGAGASTRWRSLSQRGFGRSLSQRGFGRSLSQRGFGRSLIQRGFGRSLSQRGFGRSLSQRRFGRSLSQRGPAYQRWDWDRNVPTDWVALDPAYDLVIEGCGALTASSRARVDLAVWLERDAASRKRLALGRDGSTFAPHWDHWAEQERRHWERNRPWELADLVVEATGP
ncbi:nucleoside/nucleotide kinase family protein [Mariniluteicoccus flavus]